MSKSIQNNFIPKSFKINVSLPGVKVLNQERLDRVSFESIKDEKIKHESVLKDVNVEFEKYKVKLSELFDTNAAEKELKLVEEHRERIKGRMKIKKAKKVFRDSINMNNDGSVTLVNDDEPVCKHT